jgi:hypothetical protein
MPGSFLRKTGRPENNAASNRPCAPVPLAPSRLQPGTTLLKPVANGLHNVIPWLRCVAPQQHTSIAEVRLRAAVGWRIPKGREMSFLQLEPDRSEHPVDILEKIAALNHWSFDREEQDEISISIAGGWSQYTVAFTWLAELEALHVACAFDLKMPEPRQAEIASLVSLINEELWIGHFDIWPKDGVVMFRHAILLAGGAELNSHQCQAILASVVRACERYFQASQFVVWAGKSGHDALATVMLETKGRA